MQIITQIRWYVIKQRHITYCRYICRQRIKQAHRYKKQKKNAHKASEGNRKREIWYDSLFFPLLWLLLCSFTSTLQRVIYSLSSLEKFVCFCRCFCLVWCQYKKSNDEIEADAAAVCVLKPQRCNDSLSNHKNGVCSFFFKTKCKILFVLCSLFLSQFSRLYFFHGTLKSQHTVSHCTYVNPHKGYAENDKC